MTDPRVKNLACILVHYSIEVKPGERVMIWGFPLEPVAAPLIREVCRQVLKAGAIPFTSIDIEGLDYIYFTEAGEGQLQAEDPFMRTVFEEFDADIRIGCRTNTRSLNNTDPSKRQVIGKKMGPLMQIADNRTARGEYRWVVTRYPTNAYAQDANMSLEEFEDLFYGAVHADEDDPVAWWQQVHREQAFLVGWLEGKERLVLKGPHVDMSLSIRGRKFINSSGQANMPDGEIFTGPVEDSANGWIRFDYPASFQGVEVSGVELQFEAGRVVKASAERGEGFLQAMLAMDPGASYLGEFAIGTNFEVDRITRSMLLDEKMGGTIHLALGSGYAETGSLNKSGLHWDMLCEMRDGGQIFVDGELFYDSGEFVVQP